MPTSPKKIYTVGHSTRKQEELIELLKHYGVETLVDIRRIPFSRHNPQFNRETVMKAMEEAGIHYEHVTELGGVKPSQEVIDRARSCSERSRGFAGYMETETFQRGLDRAIALAADNRIALMCAESDPSHCHRFWVADALVERGIEVEHIVTKSDLRDHPRNLFSL